MIAQNKKAFHDYHIEERAEAGLVLTGGEVKALRSRQANLRDSYALIKGRELFLLGLHIPPCVGSSSGTALDPDRTRKLLLHRHQLDGFIGKVQTKGYTVIPTKVYFKEGLVKVEIGLAKGKTLYDKRKTLAERDAKRDMERALRFRSR